MMRTRIYRIMAFAILALAGMNNANAQGLYTAGQTIKGDGFTYVVEEPWIEEGGRFLPILDIRLRSANNTFTGIAPRNNGVLISSADRAIPITSDDNIFKKFDRIINAVLSSTDKQNTNGSILSIEVAINSKTGKIIDVEFYMDINSGFAKIAPEKYYQIETQLKQQVTYSINSVGCTYNYNHDGWSYYGTWFRQPVL